MKTWLPIPLLALACWLPAQNVWQKILPAGHAQLARDIAPAADGNFWVLTNYLTTYDTVDVRLLKINLSGDVVDTKVFPFVYGMALQTFADGSLAVLGQRISEFSFDNTALALKLDPQGQLQWQAEMERGYAHAMTPDGSGGYFVGGLFDKTGSLDQSFLARLNGTGAVLWNKKYDIVSVSAIQALFPMGGELLAVGGTRTIGAGLDGFFLLKVNAATGDEIWQVTQDVGHFDLDAYNYSDFQPAGIAPDANGNVVVAWAGSPQYADGSGIFRFSPADGALLKENLLTSFSDGRYPMDLSTDPANNLIIAGAAGADLYGGLKPLIEKRKPNGQVIWSHRLALPGQLTGLAPAPDGGFIACGVDRGSLNAQAGQPDRVLLVRFDSTGNAYPCRIEGHVKLDANLDCLTDAGGQAFENWHLLLDDSVHLATGPGGYFRADVSPGVHSLRLLTPALLYEACEDIFFPNPTLNDPVAAVDFAVQKGPDCPLLEVGLTQVDLVPCDTAALFVGWQNRGNAPADDVVVTATLPPALTLLDAGFPYVQNGQTLTFSLGAAPAGSSGAIRLRVRLDCAAPLYATHCVEARIMPQTTCWVAPDPAWSGAVVRVDGECLGDQVRFTARNEGVGLLPEPLPYRLFLDAALVQTGTLQPQPGQPVTLDYPAAGRTVALETEQAPGYPGRSFPGAVVEACGVLDNGFTSTGFVRMFARSDAEPWVSTACLESSGRPSDDRIYEIPRGYGIYHLITPDTVPTEFSVRVSNAFGQTADHLSLALYPSRQFDLSSFVPLSWSHPFSYENGENGEIIVKATGLALPPGGEFDLRFRLQINPDPALTDDFASIAAEAYFDEQGPVQPYEAFFNIGENYIAPTVTPASDDPDVRIFGRGKALDFTDDFVQLPNGDICQLGVTSVFGEGQDTYLVRTDSTGQGIWQKNYRFGEGRNYPIAALPLPDGSVLIGGSFEDVQLEDYLDYSYAFIARIAADGELLWVRAWKPGNGGSIFSAALTPDGNAVFWGVGYEGNSDWLSFMLKISPENVLLWEKNYPEFIDDNMLGGRLKAGDDGYLYCLGGIDNFFSNYDYRAIRLDWNGTVVFSAGYADPPDIYPYFSDYTPTADGGVLLAGDQTDYDDATQDYITSIVLAKLSPQFQQEWYKTQAIPLLGDITALAASGGAFFLAGDMFLDTIDYEFDALLAKTDSAGELLWIKTFPINAREYSARLFIGQHNRLWMTAQTQTVDNVFDLQIALLRGTDPDALVHTGAVPDPARPLHIRPIPASQTIWATPPAGSRFERNCLFDVVDAGGRVVLEGRWQPGAGISVGNLPNGTYLLRLHDSEGLARVGKFVVAH